MLHRVPLKIIIVAAALVWAAAAQAELDVSGRVVSSEGHGLEGTEVLLYATENRFHESAHRRDGAPRGPAAATVRTVAEGHFHLTVPAAGLYTVVVDSPGRLPWQYPLALIEPTYLPTIALSKAAEHRLRVLDGAGEPVTGAFATVGEASRWSRQKTAFGDWLPAAQVARADADGQLHFRRETVRSVDLVVWAPGFLEAELPSGKRGSSEVRLEAGVDRRIEVRDADGLPLPGALVRLGVGGWPAGLTDAEGRLRLSGPRDRSLPLEVVTADGRAS
ncbi:MAG: carboxypeptidase-like regulatory domain-containing protein, partial [Acidobacteriota bacterium]